MGVAANLKIWKNAATLLEGQIGPQVNTSWAYLGSFGALLEGKNAGNKLAPNVSFLSGPIWTILGRSWERNLHKTGHLLSALGHPPKRPAEGTYLSGPTVFWSSLRIFSGVFGEPPNTIYMTYDSCLCDSRNVMSSTSSRLAHALPFLFLCWVILGSCYFSFSDFVTITS